MCNHSDVLVASRVASLAFLRPNNSNLAFYFLPWPRKINLAIWLFFGRFQFHKYITYFHYYILETLSQNGISWDNLVGCPIIIIKFSQSQYTIEYTQTSASRMTMSHAYFLRIFYFHYLCKAPKDFTTDFTLTYGQAHPRC